MVIFKHGLPHEVIIINYLKIWQLEWMKSVNFPLGWPIMPPPGRPSMVHCTFTIYLGDRHQLSCQSTSYIYMLGSMDHKTPISVTFPVLWNVYVLAYAYSNSHSLLLSLKIRLTMYMFFSSMYFCSIFFNLCLQVYVFTLLVSVFVGPQDSS